MEPKPGQIRQASRGCVMATTDSTRETEKRVSAGAFEHLVAGHRMADSFDEELRVRKKVVFNSL